MECMRAKLQLAGLLVLIVCSAAAPSWNTVSVQGSYDGRGETALSRCDGDKICLVGGRGSSPVGIFDTSTRSWAQGKAPPFEIHHFQAVAGPDGCAWVVGAWTGPFPNEDNVDDMLKYCPSTDTWSTVGAVDRPRGSGGAFLYGGAIYLVSGNVGGHNRDAELVTWFDRFDLETEEWTRLPDIPNPRDHFHAVVIDDKVYVAGGRDSTGDLPDFFDDVESSVDVYDFGSGEWSTLEDFPRPRGGTFSAVLEDKVYVLGGEGEGRAWSEVDVLKGSKFISAEEMPVPRHGTGAVACNGAIWVAGGVKLQGGGSLALETVAFFDGDEPPVCTKEADSDTTTVSSASDPPSATPGIVATPLIATSVAPTPLVATKDPDELAPTVEPGPFTTSMAGIVTNNTADSIAPANTPSAIQPSGPSTPLTEPASSASDSSDEDTTSAAVGDDEANEEGSVEDGSSNNSEASTTSDDNDRACFPSDALVELRDGSFKTMAEVRIGDYVKVAHPDGYSPVFFFSHRHPKAVSEMIRIETSLAGLSISPGHYLYINGQLGTASSARVGDRVSAFEASSLDAIVTSTSKTPAQGLYNPHTLHGDIVVNGVAASTFTSALHPSFAKMLLSPFRVIFGVVGAHASVESLNHAVLRVLDVWYWGVY